MAVQNPSSDHKGAFTTGWRHAVEFLQGNRDEYKNPNNSTWQATGYRHGLINKSFDYKAIKLAWKWSKKERNKGENINVENYRANQIILFIDDYLEKSNQEFLTPPEANRLLENEEIMKDRSERSGLPLRNMLREGYFPFAHQYPEGSNRWRIPHSNTNLGNMILPDLTFKKNRIYSRTDIHDKYGGQRMSGISTPKDSPFIFLFTGEEGKKYGYVDGWKSEYSYIFSGEGQEGDQEFNHGNKAISHHVDDGKDIILFEKTDQGKYRLIDFFEYDSHYFEDGPDVNNSIRRTIKFKLSPVKLIDEGMDQIVLARKSLDEIDLPKMRNLAYESQASSPERKSAITVRKRSKRVKEYVLARANGICEGCNQGAPFFTTNGRPYLETHHIRRLSDGGYDKPEWVTAVCPNCHMRAHYAEDGETFGEILRSVVLKKEDSYLTQ
jgi:5-methylcytosine-specific restriction enzyme A